MPDRSMTCLHFKENKINKQYTCFQKIMHAFIKPILKETRLKSLKSIYKNILKSIYVPSYSHAHGKF